MNCGRIMIAAPKSGSGKTMLTCALLQALLERGMRPVSFKCGPDYIDPMFHERVLGVPSRNLDTFFTGEDGTARLLAEGCALGEFAVLEGVMGLFDGLGGIRKEGSSYHLAEATKTPILLVVDAKGMSRSVIPLIAGFLAYDRAHLICGVILNRMSKAAFEALKPLLEKELPVPVFGFLPERKELQTESRHLGLVLPQELEDLRGRLKEAAEALRETVSLEAVIRAAQNAPRLQGSLEIAETKARRETLQASSSSAAGEWTLQAYACPEGHPDDWKPVIAVARDEAFCFYYEDNLRLLQEKGARLRFFSPLRDTALPEGTDAVLLGGGYPELYARELSLNVKLRRAIKDAFLKKLPMVAECGGFMYLHDAIEDENKERHSMAGVVPGICFRQKRLVRFGYIELMEKHCRFLPEGERIRGHEFHYYDSTGNGDGCIAIKPVTGREYSCVVTGENCWLGFPHLYYPSNPAFAERFVEMAGKSRRR